MAIPAGAKGNPANQPLVLNGDNSFIRYAGCFAEVPNIITGLSGGVIPYTLPKKGGGTTVVNRHTVAGIPVLVKGTHYNGDVIWIGHGYEDGGLIGPGRIERIYQRSEVYDLFANLNPDRIIILACFQGQQDNIVKYYDEVMKRVPTPLTVTGFISEAMGMQFLSLAESYWKEKFPPAGAAAGFSFKLDYVYDATGWHR
jgi:hypothetical protein